MDKIKPTKLDNISKSLNKKNTALNKKNTALNKKKSVLNKKNTFLNMQNLFYILLVSVCISAILVNLFGIKSINNIFELYFIVLTFTIIVLYQLLKKKKQTLDKLESESIVYFICFVLLILFFGLFIKFTASEKDSIDGRVFAVIFILLVIAFINLIFFIIGMG